MHSCVGALQFAPEVLVTAHLLQVDVLHFEEDIRGRWAAEAMRWLLQSSSRHLTSRSHQVRTGLREHVAVLHANLPLCKASSRPCACLAGSQCNRSMVLRVPQRQRSVLGSLKAACQQHSK